MSTAAATSPANDAGEAAESFANQAVANEVAGDVAGEAVGKKISLPRSRADMMAAKRDVIAAINERNAAPWVKGSQPEFEAQLKRRDELTDRITDRNADIRLEEEEIAARQRAVERMKEENRDDRSLLLAVIESMREIERQWVANSVL